MAVLDRHEPTTRELRWFGLLLASFAALLGGLVLYLSNSWLGAGVLWAVGLLLALVYYGLPSTRYLLFRLWMTLFFPIGWLISHLLMAMVYYLLITPTAQAMRLIGRDALGQAFDSSAKTYWTAMEAKPKDSRYFQQF